MSQRRPPAVDHQHARPTARPWQTILQLSFGGVLDRALAPPQSLYRSHRVYLFQGVYPVACLLKMGVYSECSGKRLARVRSVAGGLVCSAQPKLRAC